MMQRDPFSDNPLFIGAEKLFDQIDRTVRQDLKYPPYNMLKSKDDKLYLLEFAVSGFTSEELDVEVEGTNLVVRGKKVGQDSLGLDYVHKGISNRDFARKFMFGDEMEVKDVSLKNGILRISIEKIVNEPPKKKFSVRDD